MTRKENIRTRDAAQTAAAAMGIQQRSLASSQDSSTLKSPSESAILAQRLASESSWADRYMPSTPSVSIMTPGSSVADHSERMRGSEYMTPDEAPPSYEDVASMSSSQVAPVQPSNQPPQFAARTPRPFLPGRRYSRHEESQSITGTFTLYDSLNLSTSSGAINIKLDVQSGSNPARLILKSSSGSITVNDKQCDIAMTHRKPSHGSRSGSSNGGLLSFLWGSRCPSNDNPPIPSSDDPRKQPGQHLAQQQEEEVSTQARVIQTTIETSSGSVNAHLLLTPNSSTHIKTKAGSINLRLVTADTSSSSRPLSKLESEDTRLTTASNLGSEVTTTSSAGSQSVQITTGVSDTSSGAIVSACKSKHYTTGSASIRANYPTDWAGLVHASVGGSASVDVRGQGLEYDRRGNKDIWAWRGTDEPDIEKAVEVRCDGSGTVRFEC